MSFAKQGLGLGLRPKHYLDFLASDRPPVDWVEVISENFMAWRDQAPTKPLSILEKVREKVPVALHGVSLSIGSTDELDFDYLSALKKLIERIQPAVVSDHLCWTGIDSENLHDLMPLPATPEVIPFVVERLQRVQDFLGRRILIENVSSYLEFSQSTLTEWEFINEISRQADCGILLDVNNVYVNSVNHGFDPVEFLRSLSPERIGQIHLAGHTDQGDVLVDTHDEPVTAAVWSLYRKAFELFGPVNAMIEWDAQIPPLDRLLEEVGRIKSAQSPALNDRGFSEIGGAP